MTAPAEPHPLPVAEAAVDDLRHAHRDLLRVVDSLSDVDWRRPVPYGEWTVKDLVAHVIGDMSPSGPGLILAGVLTPQFIADTSKGFDVRARNRSLVEERRRFTKEDLRQMLFEAHDAMIAAMLRLQEQHLPVLRYAVPMGPGYELHVEDWLWHGYHDRQHADDISRALEGDYRPRPLPVLPEIEARFRRLTRYHDGFIRAVYSAAAEAWDERSEACPEWTHREILAHVATNDQRPIARLRAVLGERDEAALAAGDPLDEEARVGVYEDAHPALRRRARLAGMSWPAWRASWPLNISMYSGGAYVRPSGSDTPAGMCSG